MTLIPGKKNDTADKNWKTYILPVYIVVSLLIIAFFIYNFIMNSVYNSGMTTGAQRGYQTAIEQLIENASIKCEAVSVTSGDKKVDVINVACLQNQQDSSLNSSVSAE